MPGNGEGIFQLLGQLQGLYPNLANSWMLLTPPVRILNSYLSKLLYCPSCDNGLRPSLIGTCQRWNGRSGIVQIPFVIADLIGPRKALLQQYTDRGNGRLQGNGDLRQS